MTAPFAVDIELLQDVVDRMTAFERNLDERLGELDTRIGRLHQVWSGDAAAEQARAHREWLTGAQRMRAALVTLRAIATAAHANYAAAIAANRHMWG